MSISEQAVAKSGGPKLCPSCKQPINRRRSHADHNRLFAIIGAADENWPERSEFQPKGAREKAEHLRAWLACKAGYHTVTTHSLPIVRDPVLIANMMEFAENMAEAEPGYKFERWKGTTLYVFRPRSMNWETLGKREFSELRDAICEIIAAEIGIDCDTLLKEHERAA